MQQIIADDCCTLVAPSCTLAMGLLIRMPGPVINHTIYHGYRDCILPYRASHGYPPGARPSIRRLSLACGNWSPTLGGSCAVSYQECFSPSYNPKVHITQQLLTLGSLPTIQAENTPAEGGERCRRRWFNAAQWSGFDQPTIDMVYQCFIMVDRHGLW